MNSISLNDIYLDLQRAGNVTDLENLLTHLGHKAVDPARFAPSPVTRSDVELFGCASPRFAYRAYLKPGWGFINLRRVTELSENATILRGADATPVASLDHYGPGTLTCIADCLLPTTPSLAPLSISDFFLLSADLAREYGEVDPDDARTHPPDRHAVPYVKNLQLVSGLCSQACLFMASALLHREARGLHGLAEITAIAHGESRARFAITGLNGVKMSRYMDSIGLRLTCQFTSPAVREADGKRLASEAEKVLQLESAIISYIEAGFPVILPVDQGKMSAIYSQNGITSGNQESLGNQREARQGHAIIIVGFATNRPAGQGHFLFHDPATLPFLFASSAQLAGCGVNFGGKAASQYSAFWPVTPERLKMPLLHYQRWNENNLLPGLRPWSAEVRASKWHPFVKRIASGSGASVFVLRKLRSVATQRVLKVFETGEDTKLPTALNLAARQLAELHEWSLDHWVWLEICGESIWIWDAEAEPAGVGDETLDTLVAVVKIDYNREWEILVTHDLEL